MKTILLVIFFGTLWALFLLADAFGAIHIGGHLNAFFFKTTFGGIVFIAILVLFAVQSVRFFLPARKAGRPQRQFDPSRN